MDTWSALCIGVLMAIAAVPLVWVVRNKRHP